MTYPSLETQFDRTLECISRDSDVEFRGITFWQTTHNGSPNASSHSPGPKGKLTSPSAELLFPPSNALLPRPRSRQLIITSSIFSLQSVSRETSRVRRSLIQPLNSLNQNQGCDQSSNITMSVLDIVSGVRRGCNRGVKESEGSARRYMERRARVSARI